MTNYYQQYKGLLDAGKTPEEALREFEWMHPISLSRFKALISLMVRQEAAGQGQDSDPTPKSPRLAK